MSSTVDVTRLRQVFTDYECHGVVELIEYLLTPRGQKIYSLGSSTIGLGEIIRASESGSAQPDKADLLQLGSLHIGSRDGSVTPLQWLGNLAATFERIPLPTRQKFDAFCRDMARIATAPLTRPVEIFNGSGIYRVPQDAYHDEMTDGELAPYRVERSTLDEDPSDAADN